MHTADIVILVVIGISALFGVFRGFVREAFSLAGWFAAYVVARLFHAPLEQLLQAYISTPSLRMAAAWGSLFAGTLLLSGMAGYMVMSLLDSAGVRGIDRVLGGAFGVARGLIVVLTLLILAAPFASRDAWWQTAALPSFFMRYELAGREFKSELLHAVKNTGSAPSARSDHKTEVTPAN